VARPVAGSTAPKGSGSPVTPCNQLCVAESPAVRCHSPRPGPGGPRRRSGAADTAGRSRRDSRAARVGGGAASDLDDGPLTVYDLERLGRAPARLVLSACHAGRLAPTGADELLGLASSLIPLGTASLVAAVVEVDDAATASLMVALHDHVRRGASLPLAMCRTRSGDDPLAVVTASSFICLGAASPAASPTV
jgi:hypothetical protein